MSVINPTWSKLVDSTATQIWRGAMLRMPGGYLYEAVVDFMVIEIDGGLGLLVASGYKAGIIRQRFPKQAFETTACALSRSWLVDNWSHWVDQGNVQDVWIRQEMPVPDSLPA
jgi:hypothetical protein